MSSRKAIALLTLGSALSTALVGCPSQDKKDNSESSSQPSPNASILPAPLASGAELPAAGKDAGRGGLLADDAGRLIVPEAGPPVPTPLREDVALSRDTLTQKDGNGVTLDAVWKWPDVPAPAGTPETNADGIKKAREKAVLRTTIDLAPAGRMRFSFSSAAFPLPFGAELRAKQEHYGHVLVWPDGSAYRNLPAGTLRALLAERRADALPLTQVKPTTRGNGSYLGLETTKTELRTSVGTLLLEQANVPNIGQSGELLCRLLVDLIAVDPATEACRGGQTPLKASLRGGDHGRIDFEVTAMTRRLDLPIGLIFVPPAGAQFRLGQLPPPAAGVLLSATELAAFRNKPAPDPNPPENAPGEGLIAVNHTDSLRYLLVDGVAVAWIAPRSELLLVGILPGRYSIGWRDLLGTNVEPAVTLSVPARVSVGAAPDAGTTPP